MAEIYGAGGGFGGRGSPGLLPNVNTLSRGYGGFGMGGLASALSQAPWKKRLQGAAPFPGGGGGGEGGLPEGGGIPTGGDGSIVAGRPLPRDIGMRPPPGINVGRGNGLPNLDPNFNIYREYPGFKPITWHGDALGGLDRLRGAKPEQLQRLSDASVRLQSMGPMQRNVSGIGFGLSDPMAQFRKLLQARMGGV